MNIKAVAGYLNTKESEITRCDEWQHVYFVQVRGFRPRFVSKRGLQAFVAADKRKYNPGQYLHGDNLGYCKSYGSCPIWDSPKAKAVKSDLNRIHANRSIPADHPAAAFFPAA